MKASDMIPGKHFHPVSVYRGDHDSTAGGVSSASRGFRHYVVLLPGVPVPDDAGPETCYLQVVNRVHGGPVAVPTTGGKARTHGMFGGHFVWTSDSRFRANVSPTPIPVHDRFEASMTGGETAYHDDGKGGYAKDRA